MRLPKMLACSFFLFTSIEATAAKLTELVVMSFNLRVPVDSAPLDWSSRRPLVTRHLKLQQPDFFGVQEAIPNVIGDIALDFPKYAFIGRGRDKDWGGEGTQIFYRKSAWKLDETDHGTKQLSPTPEIPGSNGWGMQFLRIFTWGRFINKKSDKAVYVFNTHFPLVPGERLLSSILLARAIADRKNPQDPVILSGDFNACEIEDSMQYFLAENASPIYLIDSYRALYPDDKTGTFHDFGRLKDSCKVDYILISKELTSVAAGIIEDDPTKGFASDHYAVFAKLRFTISKE